MSFAELPAESLNGAERALLSRLETQGIALRNKALIGHVTAPAILDTVVSRDIQDHWAMGAPNVDLDTERIALATERDMDPDHSDPHFQRGETLLHRPDGEGIFADLLAYVGRILPDPSRTDGRFWTATALPKTKRGGQRALLTLSCGDVETLVMLEDEQGPYVFMNAHRNLIDEGAWTMGGELVARTHHVDRYKSVSGTAYIEVFGIGYLDELLDTVPGLETAARTLALSLMRKGPSVHAKNHNTPLTDCILRHLSDTKLEGRQSPADGRVSSTGA